MTGHGVSDGDMPTIWRGAQGEASGIPDADLAAVLAGGRPAADAPPSLQHVADVLAALRAAPASDEARGQGVALAQFRQQVGVSSQLSRSHRRRPNVLSSLLSAKTVAAAAIAAISLGGVTTAAFADKLPAAAQQVAHDAIGAPSPHSSGSEHASNKSGAGHSGTPAGPNASGSAAFGLCTAYANATQHGTAAQKAVAFRNLSKAAGGWADVASFCAGVPHPGASPRRGSRAPTSHPTGEPTSHGTGAPRSHPTDMATSHPTGSPDNG
jgi:hypothetical protein